MARDNRINMPSSGGGLTRYFDDHASNIMISPQVTVLVILAVIVVIVALETIL